MRKLLITIPTYNRPKLLLDLLKEIKAQQGNNYIKVLVVNDASTEDYSAIKEYLNFFNDFEYYELSENLGKYYFWQLHNFMFSKVKKNNYFDYYIQLPDDVGLVDSFFNRAINEFGNEDILNILTVRSHHLTYKSVEVIEENNVKYFISDFWDSAGIHTFKFYEAINFECPPVDLRTWVIKPHTGSGVGRYISAKYKAITGKNIRQVYYSLLIHKGFISQMNPVQRKKDPCYSVLDEKTKP